MAKTAVVFSGRNGLDFNELRNGILRIPDVTIRLREAQKLIDGFGDQGASQKADLMATIASDDEHFFRNIKLKSLASAIVQVGLYDRLLRTQRRPDYMVGNSNGDSAMLVCAGQITFKEMIEKSQALEAYATPAGAVPGAPSVPSATVVIPLAFGATPLLSGLSLTEYSALKSETKADGTVGYQPMTETAMELRKVIGSLHQDHGVDRFVSIGPASALRGSDYRALGAGDIESTDSIDLDPMLGWFWRNVRPQASALAQ